MDMMQQAFVTECRDLITQLEQGLMQLEQQPQDSETLNAVFRAAHTIKGAAATVGCPSITGFTHVLENTLDALRSQQRRLDAALIEPLLAAVDHLHRLLDFYIQDLPPDADTQAADQKLQQALAQPTPATAAVPPPSLTDTWHLSVQLGRNLFKTGQNPLFLLQALAELGDIVHLESRWDRLPSMDQFDPEDCYLDWDLVLRSGADKQAIEQVFAFALDDGQLRLTPPPSQAEAALERIHALPEDPMRLGEILVRSGALTENELNQGLQAQQQAENARLGEILVTEGWVPAPLVSAAVEHQIKAQEKQQQESRLIKVSADKLDQLINLVAELVIAGASAHMVARACQQPAVLESLQGMGRLVESIRDSAMQMRMVPVGELFQRFQRVVRDTSHDIGKQVQLVMEGSDTELDKSIVDKLAEPLMHLIRNGIDHGIEPPEARRQAGKNPQATLKLSAWHDSGNVWMEVRDDGRGLDLDKIRRQACARGLCNEDDSLSDEQIQNFIFEPGFSTAEQLTALSGRGVGLDVVKKTIQSLRGHISIQQQRGQGCAFRLRLPLTMAIIDGFLMRVGEHGFVVPLDAVEECLEWRDSDRIPGSDLIHLRGEALPCLKLSELFNLSIGSCKRANVVVVNHEGQRKGLVVDTLVGQCQIVVKPLGELFHHLRGLAGSTILGDGSVALILDLPGIMALQARRTSRPPALSHN